MDSKTKGTLLGIAGVILWFMPLAYVSFGKWGQGFQAGHHIGGIAYLLLISSGLYAFFSWKENHQLRVIFSSIATGICVLFLLQAGSSVAWGLIALLLVSGVSIFMSLSDKKKEKMADTLADSSVASDSSLNN